MSPKKGWKPKPEHVEKLRQSNLGKKRSPEHVAAMVRGSKSRKGTPLQARRRRMREDPAFYAYWYALTFSEASKAKQQAGFLRNPKRTFRPLSSDQRLLKLLHNKQWSTFVLGTAHGHYLLRSKMKLQELFDCVVQDIEPDWKWKIDGQLADVLGQDVLSLPLVHRLVAECNAELAEFRWALTHMEEVMANAQELDAAYLLKYKV